MRKIVLVYSCALLLCGAATAATCTSTGFVRDSINMTAALINPSGTVSGDVDATGCNIGVFYDHGSGMVSNANIHGANYFGVVAFGDFNNVNVDVKGSSIHDIGESPLNGTQHGVGVYFRAFFSSTARGTISGNTFMNYQKGGIVTNGVGTSVQIRNNVVTGQGPVPYIAQNGIQVGYGASAQVMGNVVTGNSYTGSSTVSGGIIVVGGAGYGFCPDSNPCPYTTGTQIVNNTAINNDVGIFLTNLDAAGNAPVPATNVKAVNNTLSSDGVHNGLIYQAGVSDVGNNDKIINNTISGPGYDPNLIPGSTFAIDTSLDNRPKVHANKVD